MYQRNPIKMSPEKSPAVINKNYPEEVNRPCCKENLNDTHFQLSSILIVECVTFCLMQWEYMKVTLFALNYRKKSTFPLCSNFLDAPVHVLYKCSKLLTTTWYVDICGACIHIHTSKQEHVRARTCIVNGCMPLSYTVMQHFWKCLPHFRRIKQFVL